MYGSLSFFVSRKSIVSVIGVVVALLNNGSPEDGVFSGHHLNSRFSRILSAAKHGKEYDASGSGMPTVVSLFSYDKEDITSLLKEIYGEAEKLNMSDEEKIIKDINKYRMSCNYSAIPSVEEFGAVVYNKTDQELDAEFNDLDELSETFKDDVYNYWVRVMKNEENKFFETFDDLSTYYDTLKEENLILDNYKAQKLSQCISIVPPKAQKLLPELNQMFKDWVKNETLYKNEFGTLISSVKIAWRALTNYALYECKKIFIKNLDEVEDLEEEKSMEQEMETAEIKIEENTSEKKKAENTSEKKKQKIQVKRKKQKIQVKRKKQKIQVKRKKQKIQVKRKSRKYK
ncbi:Plasmodium exported protein (PHISTb), unknown, putative [Plasmodium sp. gorilla clade G3]|nr:Plasmodium exported protein (PHISTb), unknown, putative [Plasmodium sp. gorilla clade G3]